MNYAEEAIGYLKMADEIGVWDEMVSQNERWYVERCQAHAQALATLALVDALGKRP